MYNTRMLESYEKRVSDTEPLSIGDHVIIAVESQYNDNTRNLFNESGIIIDIDPGDVWSYNVQFDDGTLNWFKRYHLMKSNHTKEDTYDQ